MRIVELKEEHLRSLELREIERTDLGDTISEEDISYFMSSDCKFAVLDKSGKAIMCTGGKMTNSTCHTWLLAGPDIHKSPVVAMRAIMKCEAIGMIKMKPKAFFTYNLKEFPFALKFLYRIGYREHGIDSDFGDGRFRVLLIKEVRHGR